MPLIDITYFIGEINIAGWDQKYLREKLCVVIKQRGDEFMNGALGRLLYAKFIAGIATDPRFQIIRDGGTYKTKSGEEYYQGLVQSSINKSVIANYVYYWYQRNYVSQTTSTGEVSTETDNAKNTGSEYKLTRAFNEVMPNLKELWCMLQTAIDDAGEQLYPEFDPRKTNPCLFHPINILGI